jgi:hypothetical protein
MFPFSVPRKATVLVTRRYAFLAPDMPLRLRSILMFSSKRGNRVMAGVVISTGKFFKHAQDVTLSELSRRMTPAPLWLSYKA